MSTKNCLRCRFYSLCVNEDFDVCREEEEQIVKTREETINRESDSKRVQVMNWIEAAINSEINQ